jgi:uncharacterized protein (TIGR02687 family)
MNKINEALKKRFEEHRIIFWYDGRQEFTDIWDELELPGVETIAVNNNEFEAKHIITRQKPDTKFLLYFQTARPANEDNWLLDQELAHHVFHTDREATYLQELGLGYHLKELVSAHIEFFKSKERRSRLGDTLGHGDEYREIQYKMLAVLFGTEYVNLVTFILAHGSAYIQGSDRFEKELERFGLHDFYWKEIAARFGYHSDKPFIYDFLLEVFSNNFPLGKKTGLSKESRLLISIWKNTFPFREHFGALSSKVAADMQVEQKLSDAPLDLVAGDELFQLTDMKVIHELVHQIAAEIISTDKVQHYIKLRENKFWYDDYRFFYAAISFGAEMIVLVRKYQQLQYETFSQGAEDYTQRLQIIDRLYRKFIHSYRKTNQNRILANLAVKVEKVYANDWLMVFSNNWQKIIDSLDSWPRPVTKSQANFFSNHVQPFINKGQRLFVIISDAFRFECGAELNKLLSGENRFESSLDYLVGILPGYTQLGMAALLPHRELSLRENSDNVLVDGLSSLGTAARAKILEKSSGVKATAINAEDFMKMNAATEGRDFVKQYELIYIYHNRIDKVGDDKTTEDKVFEAVEDELEFLRELLKKIANMNGYNMLITADHGFLYQHTPLEDSDFSVTEYSGDIWKEARRFVLGSGLISDNKTRHFSGEAINLNAELLTPKSIHRIRIKGAGSRFIHGGVTFQEVMIPVVKVSKKRQDTTSQVEVDIIKSTDRITTNILAVSFIQTQPVSDKVQSRSIRAAIYADDGELLSDIVTFNFNIKEDSARQREMKHRFQLSAKASGKYKNQRVKLLLEEPVEGANKWKHYKDFYYSLNISFTSDFDDI